MKIEEKIRESINFGKLVELEHYLGKENIESFGEKLIKIAFESENIVVYTIVCMLLIKKESSELHYLAAKILIHPLCIFEGAYSSALYHVRKAINLSPKETKFKEALLFFSDVPDKLVEDKEALRIASEIIKQDPSNKCAIDVIKRIG